MTLEFDKQPLSKGDIVTFRTVRRPKWWQFWKNEETIYEEYVVRNVANVSMVLNRIDDRDTHR